MDTLTRYNEWMQCADENTKAELSAISAQEKEERFYTELAFGTAGLRGILGAGTNRMNGYVVRRATEGLCRYLADIPEAKRRGVAIAYDSRHCSADFALQTALVLVGNGFRAYLFDSLHAVPQLSFTLRHLGCIAGVVITASHNPAVYNGYKVYWEHGGQMGPVQADAVYECMRHIGYFEGKAASLAEAEASGLLTMIGKAEDEAYYAATQKLLLNPAVLQEQGASLNLVYTPLHGTGNVPVRELLRRVGLSNLHVVAQQENPDGAFPTVAAPNPEDPNAFVLAEELANKVNADVLFATDPDADRLGVAVRGADGRFQVLTGNQIGCLLLWHILSVMHERGNLPARGIAAKSIVSTHLADAIAARYGVELRDVLTGFRYISELIDECERTKTHTYLFGFEESYGYLAGTVSRDKDAICSAMLFCELCGVCKQKGQTLLDAMEEMYQTFGFFKERVKSYTLEGKEGLSRIAGAMEVLRAAPPKALAGLPVLCYEDYQARKRSCAAVAAEPLALPQTDMLRFLLQGGAWVVVRPSGTEPKLKLYIGAQAEKEADVDTLLDTLLQEADSLLNGLLSKPN